MVDSVVVYYSPLLEAYLNTPFAAHYFARIPRQVRHGDENAAQNP